MSNIDNRIVEMQFNNKRFEQNAKETMSTLDKLKEKLNFRDQTKDLKDLQSQADSFNLNRIADAIESLGEKFTLLGNIGQAVFQKIAGAAVSAATQMTKSIFVDQISVGMSKYEQETNAVQALYAALKAKGKSLEDIYNVLDKLTAYSDETSYSYTQMADGISKFVSAGQDIDKSELVMEGIANAAALAGVSISDASIAFRNFSDAIAKGKFSLQDWKSIQNIHMDTEAFKNEVIKTAIELGKLDKEGMITTGTGKKAKKVKVTAQNFSEMLRYGFFDSDVIMSVMQRYADRTTELGDAAFKAAQQAKTFTDVLDAVKDAASTGWKQTFKIIFGDLNEAIELFTPMANKIIEVVNEIDEFRNTMLTFWKDLGGRSLAIEALGNLWQVVLAIKEGVRYAVAQGSPWTSEEFNLGEGTVAGQFGVRLYNITKTFEEFTDRIWSYFAKRKYMFGNAIAVILHVINIVSKAVEGVFTFFGEIFDQISPTIDEVIRLFSFLGNDIEWFSTSLTRNENVFVGFFKKLAAMFVPITSRLPGVIKWIRNLFVQLKVFWTTNKRFIAFRKSISNVVNAIIDFIPKAIESIIKFGKSFIEMVRNSDEWKTLVDNYNKYIKPIISMIMEGATLFNNSLASFFNMDTSDESTLWGKLKKRFSAFDNLLPWLSEKWEAIKKKLPWLQQVEDWWNSDPIINEIKEWVSEIAKAIDIFMGEDTSGETSIVGKIKKRFEAMWNELGPWLSGKWKEYKEKWPILQQIEDFIKNLFGFGKEVESTAENAQGASEKTVSVFETIWNKIVEFVSKIDPAKVLMLATLAAVLIKIYKIIKNVSSFYSIGEKIGEAIETVTSTIKQLKKRLKGGTKLQQITRLILSIGVSMWLLGETLAKVAKLSWEEIAKGLTAMGGLFVETGAFMVVMGLLTKKGIISTKGFNATSLIAMALSMYILGKALKNVSELSWEEIAKGLVAMGGLFAESGAFMILVNKFGSTSIFNKKGTSATGMITMALSMYILGKVLKTVSELSWEEIAKGLVAMGGLFAESGAFMILVNKFGSTSIFNKKGTSATGMIAMALSMYLLGKTLKSVSELSWEEIGRGLATMGSLFAESGVFMVLIGRFGKFKMGSSIGVLSTAGSMVILANKVKDLSQMSWEEIGRGLAAMAAIFAEEGAFMLIINAISKKKGLDMNAVNATTGALAFGIGSMAGSMANLGKLSWDEIGKGAAAMAAIEVLLGVFVGLMNKFSNNKVPVSSIISMIAAAGAIWIMAKAFEPLSKIESMDKVYTGLVAMVGVTLILGIFCAIMGKVKTNIKTTLGVIVSAIALAALMIAFAFALTMIKDVDPSLILAFGAAMLLISAAMVMMAATLTVFSKISPAAAIKGALVMIIAAAAIAAAVAIILAIVGDAVKNFSADVAVVGSNLSLYSDMVKDIDMDAVKNSINMLTNLAIAFTLIGSKDYGNLETFKTNLTRMGASLKLFYLEIQEVDASKVSSIVEILKDISAAFIEIGSKDYKSIESFKTNLTRMGSSVKIFYNSISSTDTGKVNEVVTLIKDISTAFAEVGGKDYGNLEAFKTNFSRMGSTVKLFHSSISSVDTDRIRTATTLLKDISVIFVEVGEKDYKNLDSFRTGFSRIGSTLKIFNTNIATVDIDRIKSASTLLKDISVIFVEVGGEDYKNLDSFRTSFSRIGSTLKLFNAKLEEIEMSTITSAVDTVGNISDKMVEIGGKEYGKVDSFRLSFSRIGSTLKTFQTNTAEFNIVRAKNVVGSLKKMAEDLSGFPEVTDVGTSIGHIGGAIKLYAQSLEDTDLSKAPDTTAIKTVFDTLKEALPNDENISEMAAYATDDKGTELTNFAIGLTNIATAVKDFASNTSEMNFDNVGKAVAALGAINTINNTIITTKITAYGQFSKDTAEQITNGALDTFATDIVTLGTAVADFGNSIKDTNFDNVGKAVSALTAISSVNASLIVTQISAFGSFSKETNTQVTEGTLDTFAADIVTLGTAVADFGNSVKDANFDNVGKAVNALNAISRINSILTITKVTSFGSFSKETNTQVTEGTLDTFATDIVTLGTAVADFGNSVKDANFDNVGKAVSALNAINSINTTIISTKVSAFGAFSAETNAQVKEGTLDTFASDIVTLGTAVADFGNSIKDTNFDNVERAVKALESINSLNTTIKTTVVTAFGSFSNEVHGQIQNGSLDTFATDVTTLGTAVGTFGENVKDINFDNVDKAIKALESITSINNQLGKTSIVKIGSFAITLSEQKSNLSTFSEDIVVLGTAAKDFGDNMSNVDLEKMSDGIDGIKKIVDVNKSLPRKGGLSSWIDGSQELGNFASGLKLLGGGVVSFNDALGTTTIDKDKMIAAGEGLIEIAKVNAALPKTGGISSWFSGDQSLGNFSTGLSALGGGVVEFVKALGGVSVTDETFSAIKVISDIAEIQTKVANADTWYNIQNIADDLESAAEDLVSANSKFDNVTLHDFEPIKSLMETAIEQQVKLGNTRYEKNLKQMGTDIKDFFNEVWNFTTTWTGGDNGKLDKVTSSITNIFGSINTALDNLNAEGRVTLSGSGIVTDLVGGITNEESTKATTDAINSVIVNIINKVKDNKNNFVAAGTWIPAGLAEGIINNRYAAINAAVIVMNDAINAAEEAAGIESPSKAFADIGMYSDLGLAKGLLDYVTVVDSAAEDVSMSALESVLGSMEEIQNLPLDEIEINPEIRPVLDTSDISSNAGIIEDLLSGRNATIGFNTKELEAQAQLAGDAANSDISSITQQMNEMQSTLVDLKDSISNIKIVLKNGVLVGELSSDIDKVLGERMKRGGRGN